MADTSNPNPDPDSKDKLKAVKDKIKKSIESLKTNEHFDTAYQYAKSNTRDMIAYLLLLLGFLLLFFTPWYGQTLIGALFGLYFYQEIRNAFKNCDHLFELHGLVKSTIFFGLLLAFFISAPFIFIGIAFSIALRYLLVVT
jgi:hypothetical protein